MEPPSSHEYSEHARTRRQCYFAWPARAAFEQEQKQRARRTRMKLFRAGSGDLLARGSAKILATREPVLYAGNTLIAVRYAASNSLYHTASKSNGLLPRLGTGDLLECTFKRFAGWVRANLGVFKRGRHFL